MASKTVVGIIMGSQSDWATLKASADMLDALGVSHDVRIVSAIARLIAWPITPRARQRGD